MNGRIKFQILKFQIPNVTLREAEGQTPNLKTALHFS